MIRTGYNSSQDELFFTIEPEGTYPGYQKNISLPKTRVVHFKDLLVPINDNVVTPVYDG